MDGRANSDGLPVGSAVGEVVEKVVLEGPVGGDTEDTAGFGAIERCLDDDGCGV